MQLERRGTSRRSVLLGQGRLDAGDILAAAGRQPTSNPTTQAPRTTSEPGTTPPPNHRPMGRIKVATYRWGGGLIVAEQQAS